MNANLAMQVLRDFRAPINLTDEEQDRWIQAISYFYENPERDAVPLLVQSFGDGDYMEIYTSIQIALQKYSMEEVFPYLEAGLRSSNLGIRCWSADTVRYFPHPDFVIGLAQLLHDSEPLARYEAAVALECITHRSIGLLAAEALLRETDEDVRDVLRDMVLVT